MQRFKNHSADPSKATVLSRQYRAYIRQQYTKIGLMLGLGLVLMMVSIATGSVNIALSDLMNLLLGDSIENLNTIVWNIRLPRSLAALAVGSSLGIAGVAMQSILRNPLGSPFTLGISNAAAFGAALSIVTFQTGEVSIRSATGITINNPWITTLSAFLAALVATGMLLAITRYRQASPESMILIGVAISSLFSAGTMFLQYFADDVQLAAVVFWTFGDLGRATWRDVGLMAIALVLSGLYFWLNRWNYNAIDAGDDTALGLGVNVAQIRLVGLIVASLVTALVVSLVGVIGFVGLVAPHMMRRLVGDNLQLLIPATAIAGANLLLGSDIVARTLLSPQVLPVAVLTSFMGAPLFIYLLARKGNY
jgi:iron complex transport system permease protein